MTTLINLLSFGKATPSTIKEISQTRIFPIEFPVTACEDAGINADYVKSLCFANFGSGNAFYVVRGS